MNIAEQIVVGSANLNRMRSEIKLVVNTILSLTVECIIEDGIAHPVSHQFQNPSCEYESMWKVMSQLGSKKTELTAFFTLSEDDYPIESIPLKWVDTAHEALSVLVDELQDEYGSLSDKLVPLIYAAENY